MNTDFVNLDEEDPLVMDDDEANEEMFTMKEEDAAQKKKRQTLWGVSDEAKEQVQHSFSVKV